MRFSVAMTDGPTKQAYTAIMDTPPTLAATKLIQVHKAHNELEGNLMVSFLHDHGVDAMLRPPPAVPPLDFCESFNQNETIDGIFVREPDADRARQLIQEFLTTVADVPSLEALAAQRPPLTKEKIGQLRGALREERRTFRFLGGTVAAFVAAALVWHWTLSYSRWSSLGAILAAAVATACWMRPER